MKTTVSRRKVLKRLAAGAATAAAAPFVPVRFAIGGTAPVKVGVMLPYTGTYAALGEAITNAMKMAIAEKGGKLGGRAVEYVVVDSEANPGKAPENMNKLVVGEKVDFVIGPVHSGVAMAMVKIARDEGTMLIIPNAGARAATDALCAPNIFRTSFSNWQPAYPMGKVAVDRGWKNVVTMAWNYGAGKEALGGFEENFTQHGGHVVKRILTPFPAVEFQAYLTEIASLKPDAVFVFYAGGGAVKYVKDYAAAGLKRSVPLLGSGFLTEGTLEAQGEAAEGVLTTLHYADTLDNPTNKRFRAAYQEHFGKEADIYAVQGYDTGQLMQIGMDAVQGDVGARKELIAAMAKAEIDSPRGHLTLSPAHNPVQDFYLREVQNGENVVLGVAAKALTDPATACKMS